MTSPSMTVVGVAWEPIRTNSCMASGSAWMSFSVNSTPLWDRNSVSWWQAPQPGCV